jgi:amino acid adenylation domain-containing protein
MGGRRRRDSLAAQPHSVWNGTARYLSDETVVDLFQARVAANPDAVALVDSDRTLTYAELNRQANQLAHELRDRGVGPERAVALVCRRGIPLVVAILATLKAGGAYVPLDPDQPHARLARMLTDATPVLILTDAASAASAPDGVVLEHLGLAGRPGTNLDREVHPENLAYVIFTSGSTGAPKGTAVTHRGLMNYLAAIRTVVGDSGAHGAPLHSPMSFDLTVTSLFLPLTAGQEVVLVSEEDTLDQLAALLRQPDRDFNLVKLTPAHFDALHGRLAMHGPLDSVRTFVVGGEALPARSVRAWRQLAPRARVVNEYGPTETVVGCVFAIVTESDTDPVPIGHPMANIQVYLLGEDLAPVPQGVTGELYLGGACVARGYLRRPGQTAERFLPDLYGPAPGARLYRTGDLARHRPGGGLEFIGRIDDQVKVRGYRIELGEVRSALLEHPDVAEAAVTVRDVAAEDRRLAGYFVAVDGATVNPAQVRQFLRNRLPAWMMPATLTELAQLPMTRNGKVDRAALPEPDDDRIDLADGYVPARTPVERMLAELWARSLGVRRVGIHDDFFELGGHSLLANQIVLAMTDLFPHLPADRLLGDMFRHPTVAGFAATLDVDVLAAGDMASRTLGSLTGPAAPADGGHQPLGGAQERVWFLDQIDASGTEYLIPIVLGIDGPLNVDALRWALSEVVDRHQVLRTSIVVHDDAPVAVLLPTAAFDLMVDDLPSDGDVAAAVRREVRRPIDLSAGLPVRARLFRVGPNEHVLCLTVHHVAFDAWSHQVLFNELAAGYAAATQAGQPSLPALPAQYADVARWLDRQLTGGALDRKVEFWRRTLAGSVPFELPPDRTRPARRLAQGDTRRITLPAALARGLERMGRRHGATPFMTVLAVTQALLARWGGRDDITVGTTVAERSRPETEALIGLFVNILVLRGDLSGNPTFGELLERTRDSAATAYAHQDVPFDHLVKILEPSRDLARTPLFQILVTYGSGPPRQPSLPGLRVRELPGPDDVSKYDLMIAFERTEDELLCGVQFDTALYDPGTVERLLAQFRVAVEHLVEHPDTRLAEIPLWSSPDQPEPGTIAELVPLPVGHLPELIARQAARTPQSSAVVMGERSLSYAELDRRATRLAGQLHRCGVRVDQPVALALDRSPEMVVAILAILRAGGAYLPIETDTPPARIAQLVTTAGVTVCVAGPGLAEAFAHLGCTVVGPDGTDAEPGGPLPVVNGLNLVSVYYTSGSTGAPKGVASTHAGWLNRMGWMQRRHGLRPGDTVLHKTTLTFDDAAVELLWPLTVGGRVALLEPGLHRDPQAILDAAVHYGAVHLQFVPSVLELFLQTLTPDDVARLGRLRSVLSSGEALRPSLVHDFFALFGDRVSLDNTWGATEVSIDSTCHVCRPADGGADIGAAPIGVPIDNNEVWVLDDRMRPVPSGVAGELYIGGLGLARGYLNDPARTAEAFRPHPNRAGERLYRTGDWGRRRGDGVLVFLDRRDDQVKVRGVRIELGEVAAALRSHPSIADAAVLAWTAAPGDKRLAAYAVTHADAPVAAADLRRYLGTVLPSYAVPDVITMLDTLPRSANGKLDRSALPVPDPTSLQQTYAPPRTPTEETLARIWAEVLGIERVGIDDDFFALGGHSLLATRAITRIRRAFEVAVPLSLMFECPTVAAAAVRVEEAVVAEISALSEEEAVRLVQADRA